jgi:FkbM family methyltransferase
MKTLIKAALEKLGYSIRKIKDLDGTSSQHIIKKIFNADDVITIFDVGAHIGQSATFYKSTFKNSNIYSFEPFQNSFEILKRLNLTDFKPYNLGLSDEKGVESFYSNKGSPTNSLLSLSLSAKETWGGIEGLSQVERVDCEFTTLDDFYDENSVEFIDFLKIDVQGAEFRVLKGAHKALYEKRIGVIQLEVILGDTYTGQKTPGYYIGLLEKYDYKLAYVSDFSFTNGELVQFDLFFKLK